MTRRTLDPIDRATKLSLANGETQEPRLTDYVPHHPHPRQALFLSPLVTMIREVFFGGAAGGGKSEAVLMAALQYVDVPTYSGVLVRRTYPMLDQPGGLIVRSHRWLDETDAEYNEGKHRWTFPSGATLVFRHLTNEAAVSDYQGSEYDFIGIDELTDFSIRQYRLLLGRLRSVVGSPVPLRVRSSSNPIGPGKTWVHRRFVAPGAIEKGRLFIPSRLEDNPSLDTAAYDATLRLQGSVLYAQLRHGDWEIGPEGELFKRADLDETIRESELPAGLDRLRYWDLAATETPKGKTARDQSDPDYTAGLLLARDQTGKYYVEDVKRGQWSPATVEQMIADTATDEDGYGIPIRMEEEPGASGKSLVSHYRNHVLDGFDFRGVRATGSKETRAQAVAARVEHREVALVEGDWNEDFIDELTEFPHGLHDDQVDAFSGAYTALAKSRTAEVEVAGDEMENYWEL